MWTRWIYTNYARQIYLCLNCFKVITNVGVVVSTGQPTLSVWLKPLGLAQAFNSTIILKVQCKGKQLSRKPKGQACQ
jgi:hypothetical protein